MIKIENVEVYGWEAAIRGMRNPKNSWDKSDSYPAVDCGKCGKIEREGICKKEDRDCTGFECYAIGENDLKLMKNLSKAGSDHAKFLRYLTVQLDITAPFYWWKEFKTYRKGRKFMDDGDEFLDPEEFELFVETNSCSTMHKIHAKEFEASDFSWEHVINDLQWYTDSILYTLNTARERFLETKDKKHWWQMIQLLPSSYNQRRTVQLNYQVLKNMYFARRNHKLDEWQDFCLWVEQLPYFKEIVIAGDD